MAEEEFRPLSEDVGSFCLTTEDRSGSVPVIQPFPRSPKLTKKPAASHPTVSELPAWLEELKTERRKTEAHLESIKKRQANLDTSSEAMKQQLQECFEGLHVALQEDEKAVWDMMEQERRETSSRLNRTHQDWSQHLGQLQKHISTVQTAQQNRAESLKQLFPEDFTMASCRKKLQKSEEEINMNEERIQKVMKALRNISKDLKVQLQRKRLLLDSSNVTIDNLTCHKYIKVTEEGRGMRLSTEDRCVQNEPLRFDQLYCALGSVAISGGQHYWEVDVHCCPSWALGVAYGTIQRRGRDKAAKLGRNRSSWSLELQEGHLTAWHNDLHLKLPITAARAAPKKIGVFVKYQKGRVTFYDADTMRTLHEFSAVQASVFDRAQHQFTEPLYPAFRFFSPREKQTGHQHMEICDICL